MARWFEPTDEQCAAYAVWTAERPPAIRALAERFPPWNLYRMKGTGPRVTIYSIEENENGPPTFKVNVSGEFNVVAFGRVVFGVAPEDLEECELPAPDERVGNLDIDPEVFRALFAKQARDV